jgi:hypothetical protein
VAKRQDMAVDLASVMRRIRNGIQGTAEYALKTMIRHRHDPTYYMYQHNSLMPA